MNNNKIKILSIENAKNWSWGLSSGVMFKFMSNNYEFSRITGKLPHVETIKCSHCNEMMGYNVPAIFIDKNIVDMFDLVMTQNVDSIQLVSDKSKIVSRMGGMRTFIRRSNQIMINNKFDENMSKIPAIIATNNELGNIAKRVNNNVHVIPNGINLNVFKPRECGNTPIDDEESDGIFKVGFAGNIHGRYFADYKGWHHYIQATLRLFPKVETIDMLFRHSQIPHEEMPKKFFHKIDCLISASINEGCSNIVGEALACGVPVLLTKVGYHGETLTDGENCIFIERNIDDIKNKIKLLMNSPELRSKLSFNGRIFAENNQDIVKIAQAYDAVFKQVLDKRSNKNE